MDQQLENWFRRLIGVDERQPRRSPYSPPTQNNSGGVSLSDAQRGYGETEEAIFAANILSSMGFSDNTVARLTGVATANTTLDLPTEADIAVAVARQNGTLGEFETEYTPPPPEEQSAVVYNNTVPDSYYMDYTPSRAQSPATFEPPDADIPIDPEPGPGFPSWAINDQYKDTQFSVNPRNRYENNNTDNRPPGNFRPASRSLIEQVIARILDRNILTPERAYGPAWARDTGEPLEPYDPIDSMEEWMERLRRRNEERHWRRRLGEGNPGEE